MAAEFDYGNARLRAMKSRLLDERDYRELLVKDLSGLIASLSQTDYKPDIETALVRLRGLPCLYQALRGNLARSLRSMVDFYEGEAAEQVRLLLLRWDRRNLLVVLRVQAAPPGASQEEILSLLVPAGMLDGAMLSELVRQPGLRAMLDLLVSWDLPDRTTARALLAAWAAYEQSGNLAILEHAANRAYALSLERATRGTGGPTRIRRHAGYQLLGELLGAEIDQVNLLLALRLRRARLMGGRVWPSGGVAPPGEAAGQAIFLPAGNLAPDLLASLVPLDRREDVLNLLQQAPGTKRWQAPLAEWLESGDLVALQAGLEHGLTRAASSLFWAGDPLSIAVPIAYTWAKENEVRNLRILGYGLFHQLDPALIREQLLIL